jgi:hypothetical protein
VLWGLTVLANRAGSRQEAQREAAAVRRRGPVN